jgi:hypothetical protein
MSIMFEFHNYLAIGFEAPSQSSLAREIPSASKTINHSRRN